MSVSLGISLLRRLSPSVTRMRSAWIKVRAPSVVRVDEINVTTTVREFSSNDKNYGSPFVHAPGLQQERNGKSRRVPEAISILRRRLRVRGSILNTYASPLFTLRDRYVRSFCRFDGRGTAALLSTRSDRSR